MHMNMHIHTHTHVRMHMHMHMGRLLYLKYFTGATIGFDHF